MVAPAYTNWAGPEPIRLSGKVLVFGSGNLVHERRIFNFAEVQRLDCYDPFVETEDLQLSSNFNYCDALDWLWSDAAIEPQYDSILCLFSLHYEPAWLVAAARLISALKKDGHVYFAVDRGTRAALDGLRIDGLSDGLKGVLSKVFDQRLSTELALPWSADLTAANARLLEEVLVPFGSLQTIATFTAIRQVSECEPDCYLPWHPDRHGPPDDDGKKALERLRDAIRVALAEQGQVSEAIEIHKFTKEIEQPVDIFDLDNPRARLMWRAVSDAAGRAMAKLLVAWPETEDRRDQPDIPYRRAALAVMYQNLLRHFRCWGAAESIIGALSPAFTVRPESQSGAYKSTVIQPAEVERFWGTRSVKPEHVIVYEEHLKSSGRGWIGSLLYTRAKESVFFWPSNKFADVQVSPFLESESIAKVGQDHPLYKQFAEREVPACLYLIDALATEEDRVVASQRKIFFGALVVYLNETKEGAAASVRRELSCLLWTLDNARAIIAGRSGFLEMQLARKELRDYSAVQEPLRVLRANADSLVKISDAVERLSFDLDETIANPGIQPLRAMSRLLQKSFFTGQEHHPKDVTTARLVELLADSRFALERERFERAIVGRGWTLRHETAEAIFGALKGDVVVAEPVKAGAFLKCIAKFYVPHAWLECSLGERLAAGFENALMPESRISPIAFLVAFDSLADEGRRRVELKDEYWEISLEIVEALHRRGQLDKLHGALMAKGEERAKIEKVGKTLRSLWVLTDAASEMASGEANGGARLSVTLKYRTERLETA